MSDDQAKAELIRGLREILATPGTSGKHLEARASAARQLARILGLDVRPAAADASAVPDPMADLDELAPRRHRRRAQ